MNINSSKTPPPSTVTKNIKKENKQTHDSLLIRIGVLPAIVIFLFVRRITNLGFWVIKFVTTIGASVFRRLSFPYRNLKTFTFWAYCDKILSDLSIFIMSSFNSFLFFFSQNVFSGFWYGYVPYKEICMKFINH